MGDEEWKGLTEIFDRLAAYEDTGLIPEEIKALTAEVERLKKSNEIYSEENSGLYQQISTLKKALRMACEDTELCPYGLHGENRRCAEDHRPMLCKSCAPEYYIQQAQEQEANHE